MIAGNLWEWIKSWPLGSYVDVWVVAWKVHMVRNVSFA